MSAEGPRTTASAPVEVKTTKLADGVYQFTVASDGYVEQLNSVAVVMASDVLLFDTTTRPSTARVILAQIRRLTGKPVRYVVNSHWHPDHWSGNEVFADANPQLEIIATEKERDLMLNLTSLWGVYLPSSVKAAEQTLADEERTGVTASGIQLTSKRRAEDELDMQRIRDMVDEQLKLRRVYPNLTYADHLTLRHGGREMRFMSEAGDAAGTTVMYLPAEKILVTGDVVSYPLPYYNTPSTHARSLRELAQLDAATIVPGHGPAFHDKHYMELEASLFEAVLTQVQSALRSGAVSIDDVQKRVDLTQFKSQFARRDPEIAGEFDQYAKGLVRRAYIELRDNKEIR
jgi:cyclase